MYVAALALIAVTLSGHLALWTFLYNRLHATGLPRRMVRVIEKLMIVLVVMAGLVLLGAMLSRWPSVLGTAGDAGSRALFGYALLSGMTLLLVTTKWTWQKFARREPSPLISNHTERFDVVAHLGTLPVGRRTTRLAALIPGNEIMDVRFHHKTLRHPNLPAALDGLRIAQLSDMHMTGQLTKAFFQVVVERTNQWQPDLVVLTGDLIEKAPCLRWVPDTFGKLEARDGKYFILGNHDRRLPDPSQLRGALRDAGWEDLGGQWLLRSTCETRVLLAGNESPWFPAPQQADRPGHGSVGTEQLFSILLSHTPDQLPWARQHRFDLMLAGHTHGGQIRIPIVGPMVCPSRFGVRYASGLFHEPPTILHVSRGLSGVQPLRFGCPPEVTLLELHRPST